MLEKKLLPQPLADQFVSSVQIVKTSKAIQFPPFALAARKAIIQFPLLPWQPGNSQLHFTLSANSSHTRI